MHTFYRAVGARRKMVLKILCTLVGFYLGSCSSLSTAATRMLNMKNGDFAGGGSRRSGPASATRRAFFATLGASISTGGALLFDVHAAGSQMPAYAIADMMDEFDVTFDSQNLGFTLEDVTYRNNRRVLVDKIVPGSQAAGTPRLKNGLALVEVNGQPVEGLTARAIRNLIRGTPRPLVVRFKDPSMFLEQLLTGNGESNVATRIAPAREGRSHQDLKVTTTEKAANCQECKGAIRGDLLEISYSTSLKDSGKLVDGSSASIAGRPGQSIAGRGGDSSLYFVLGKQPAGQFPPAFDIGLLGMCAGEKRVIEAPSLLAYGQEGLRRRGIPPDATLVYEVELLGVNGVNLCRPK